MIVIELKSGQYRIDPDTVEWTIWKETDGIPAEPILELLNASYGQEFYNADSDYYRRAVDIRVAAVLRDFPDSEVIMDTTDRTVPRGRPA